MAEHEGQSTAKARSKLPFVIVCLVIVAAAIAALTMFVLGTQGQEKQSAQSGEANHIEQTVQEPSVEPQYATGVHHVLLIGDDAWVPGPSRSDLIMLLRVDLDNYVLTEVSIPRDTAHQQPDGSLVKLNSVYESSGPDALCEAVSQLTGAQVDQYAVIGFDGLQSIVSYFGGLEVNVPYSITYSFYTHDYPDEVYQAGEQTLDPWRVMALSRARTGYTQYGLLEDMMRQIVDRQMLTTMMGYVLVDSDDPAATAQQLLPFVDTNIPVEDVLSWIEALSVADKITVYGTSGPVDGGIDVSSGLWLTPMYPEKWAELMAVVEQGGDPSTVNVQLDSTLQSDHAPINTTTILEL